MQSVENAECGKYIKEKDIKNICMHKNFYLTWVFNSLLNCCYL